MTDYLANRATPLLAGLALGASAVAAGLVAGQTHAEQALLAARWTARTAVIAFLIVYLASTFYRLWPGDLTRSILRRRRQWGLGFALAHTIHLAALAVNVLIFAPRAWNSVVAGGIAYVMILAMMLTSNDASMRALGKKWKRLHVFGIHYIWFIFFASYATRLFKPESMTIGLILTPILLGALAIRLYARYGSRVKAAALG